MIILTIRTDKPEAELGLYKDEKQLAYETWEAHRRLAETLHAKLNNLLTLQGLSLQQIQGIVIYEGPGSFTGLRIGMSVANALAYSLSIPIITAKDNWIEWGIKRLMAGESDKIAIPEYGKFANTTTPRK
ncbi:tRNA (adenosine(37)-N6)-threonylcarbamoyltransferase complex dimerization subunit type 1 TsaB [Candidatus Saccharibacteria bacterium]|nr:tRNA (adenosine(37)-N6)-threonylcarbamoyltransferase complex dimerization subunit type 1 TsaB [Candidatus Saccharibacteria bacterium]